MKIVKLLSIILLCATLFISYGCDDNAVDPGKSGNNDDGPPPGGEPE